PSTFIRSLRGRIASALGREFHGERTRRRRRNEDRDVARPFVPGPCRPRAVAAVGVRLGDRLTVEPHQIHRALDAMEVQAIATPGDALERAVAAFRSHIEPDYLYGLAQAQVGALKLAAAIGNAQPVVLIERKCATPPSPGEIKGGKAVDVDGQRID